MDLQAGMFFCFDWHLLPSELDKVIGKLFTSSIERPQVIYLSVHPDGQNIGDHSRYARGWNTYPVANMTQLSQWLKRNLCSPCIWKYGIRKASNFVFAELIAVDVDSDKSMDLQSAVEHYREYQHLIGTTKSHGIEKGGAVSDRYRVFLVLEHRISAPGIYQAMAKREAARCGGDLQASGASMHFMPLKEIVSVNAIGKRLEIPEEKFLIEAPLERSKELADGSRFITTSCGVERKIPGYIQRWLDGDIKEGYRNITCFKAACGLKERGFNEDTILSLLLSSRIPLDHSARVENEIRSAVRSAMRR